MKTITKYFIPNLVTLIVLGLFLWTQNVGAVPAKAPLAQTVIPPLISYQGQLTNATGVSVPNGSYIMQFAFYDAAVGGTQVWKETRLGTDKVTVTAGQFQVMLGEITPLPTPFPAQNLWLGVTVGTDLEMTPRERLGSVPFALASDLAAGVVTTANIADGAITASKINVAEDVLVPGFMEIIKTTGNRTPYIDFTNDALTDYDMRIILTGDDRLDITGGEIKIGPVLVLGALNSTGISSDGDATLPNLHLDAAANTTGAVTVNWYQGTGGLIIGNGAAVAVSTIDGAGNFWAKGTKAALVKTKNYGQRKLYAYEQATNRFGDEGKAKLVNGKVRVNIDPIFLETVEPDFLIHITPYGNASLYVSKVGVDYFEISSQEAGSTVEFAWMLTAPRKGYANVRLEEVK